MKAAQTQTWRRVCSLTLDRMFFFPARLKKLVKVAFLVGDPLKIQTVCQVHLRFCLSGSTSKRNSEPTHSTPTNHCQSLPCFSLRDSFGDLFSLSFLDLDGSVIIASSEWQHQFYTVELQSTGRLIAPLRTLASFAFRNFSFVLFHRCQNKSLLALLTRDFSLLLCTILPQV